MISEKIDIFLAVGQELNFSTVAKKRYTTQPTISRQIADLEDEWGMRLFTRSNKGLRLTAEGTIMLNCCKKIDHQMEIALKQAKEIKVSKRDRLRLGFLTDFNAEQLFMPAICGFAKENSELDISLEYGSFGDLRNGLKNDRLDIIFTYDFETQNFKEEVVVDYIRDIRPCFVISEAHPLYNKPDLHLSDLANEIFYLPEESDSPGRENDLRYVLRANKIANGDIRFAPNQESVLLQTRLGRGVALIESDAAQIREYGLRTVPLGGGEKFVTLSLVAIWKKDNLNPFLPMFMDRLRDESGRRH